jgi:two-component system, NtrC family, sensor histidine kinase HydH
MVTKRVRIRGPARWAWLVSTFGLCSALMASSWINQRRVVGAASSLSHGQGEDLLDHVRQRLAEAPMDDLPLDSILAQRWDAGLRYIGVVDSDHNYVAEAGTPIGDRDAFPEGPLRSTLVDLGARFRGFDIIPRRPSGLPPSEGEREGRSNESSRRRPPGFFIEYEPVVAQLLASEAKRSFVLSAVVTAVLLTITLGFWRLSLRHEAAQLRLEQQQRLGMLGEMSAVLAHEIRNPLASLKGNAQLLAERLPDETTDRKKADRIVQEAQRLEALTTDLLDFARSGPIDIRPTSPAELLSECVQEVDPDAFTVETTEAPPSWALDQNRMRQALTNVLRNARQATPAGQSSVVSVAQDDGNLIFSIRDHGPGFPPGDEKRIFSPFYTTRTTGTGLGLAVAQRVAELHHGAITAANVAEGGAVFRITIPKS